MSEPTDAELAARFHPLFARIGEHAVERERERRLAHEELAWLRAEGFGALRVPVEHGGAGASLTQLFTLLIDLAEAESNLPQALRTHFVFVEDRLVERHTERGKRWLEAIGHGAIFGNATSERGENVRGTTTTRLSRRGGDLVLNGTKFYSTGSLYADHIAVIAQRDDSGARVQVVTSATAPGLVRLDDYAGFGQRTSPSGTTTFTDVRVDPEDVIDASEDEYRGRRLAFLQLVQLAGLAGIAQRAAKDVANFVRRRRRTFAHGSADLSREDPLVQQVLGRVDSAAYAARSIVLAAAASLERATDGPPLLDASSGALEVAAEIDVYRAQVSVIDLVLRATSELFDVGGASVVDESLQLDRHWRNARTLAVHNPVVYKQRIVGEYLLGGEVPVFLSSVGVAPSVAARPKNEATA